MLSQKFRSKAFTLIELLVVISIIGLISSIVLVSMKGFREDARIAGGKKFSSSIQHVLGSDAVGIWRFEKGSGVTAYDESGYGNNGELKNFNWTPTSDWTNDGVYGNALVFDGGDDYVKIDNVVVSNPSSLTISSWFKHTGNGGTYECVLHQGSDNSIGNSAYWMGVCINDYLTATVGARTGVGWAAGQTNIKATLGEWYYLVASWDGSVVKVYINGEYINQYNLGTYSSLTTPTRFGASADGTNYQFNGAIDEVRIYEQALSAAEIQKHYTEGAAAHGIVLK